MRVQLARQSYSQAGIGMPPEICVNMYLESLPSDPALPYVLRSTPALVEKGDITAQSSIRGLFRRDDITSGSELYAVAGTRAYTVAANGTATALTGTLSATGDRVRMEQIEDGLAVVAGGNLYAISASATTQVTDGDLLSNVIDCAYLRGRLYVIQAGSGTFQWSGLLDETTWDALDFATAERRADDNVAVRSDGDELTFFGKQTLETWPTTGVTDPPVAPRPSAAWDIGCASRDSVVRADGAYWWVGDDKRIYRKPDGGSPQPISTSYIDDQLQKVADPENIHGYAYPIAGGMMVLFNLDEQGTYQYNIATGLWAERRSEGQDQFRGNCHAFAYGENWIGDRLDGKLYQLTENSAEDGDAGAVFRRICSANVPMDQIGRQGQIKSFAIDCRKGVANGEESDPEVLLSYSKDRGANFTSSKARSLGESDETELRVVWRRLGRIGSEGIILRLTVVDPVDFKIFGARINDD